MKSPFKTTNQLQLQQEQPAATNKSRMLSFRATRTTSLSLHLNKMRSVKKTSKQRELEIDEENCEENQKPNAPAK